MSPRVRHYSCNSPLFQRFQIAAFAVPATARFGISVEFRVCLFWRPRCDRIPPFLLGIPLAILLQEEFGLAPAR